MKQIPCVVSIQLDRYLNDCEKENKYQEEVENRTDEMMKPGGRYDPLDPENFGTAMAGADFTEVVKLLREGDALAAGQLIEAIARDILGKVAESEAEDEIKSEKIEAEEGWAQAKFERSQY